jgi:hypothetical protein
MDIDPTNHVELARQTILEKMDLTDDEKLYVLRDVAATLQIMFATGAYEAAEAAGMRRKVHAATFAMLTYICNAIS